VQDPHLARIKRGSDGSLKVNPEDTMPISLKLMCWNIDEGNAGLEPIAEQIRSKEPDIVLLNEVRQFGPWWPGGTDQTAELARMTNIPNYAFGATVPTGVTGWKGVSLLSRYPIGIRTMRKVMRGPSETSYGSLDAVITISGINHRVISTRFDAWVKDDNIAAHHQAVDLVRSIDGNTPVIFGGDFNAHLVDEQMQYFAANSGLKNVSEDNPDPAPCEPSPIDHIFYRGPYTVMTYELRCPWVDPAPSDHPWVFAVLNESQPAECTEIRVRTAQLNQEIRALQTAKDGLNPRNALDREEIKMINNQIKTLRVEITDLRRQAAGIGCV
jgi:endonuclease/exonuclease/phosphatase family metal-dependent hydrolase